MNAQNNIADATPSSHSGSFRRRDVLVAFPRTEPFLRRSDVTSTKKAMLLLAVLFVAGIVSAATYPIVDTGQVHCYDDRAAIEFPKAGKPYYGQDAQYTANPPSYKDNGDGTVTDNVTGLMWTQDPGNKKTFNEAVAGASKCLTGGYKDWRLPTIKELYSLIQLNGTDPDPTSRDGSGLTPFIDNTVFKFRYGKEEDGDRIIDSQFATCTKYVSTTMNGSETMFGVNFADGRIKGYGIESRGGGQKKFFVLYVRGNPAYGKNQFKDNGDGTITDKATGLTWMKADSGKGMDWPTALDYAENLELAGHSNWRLPNAKELQSIIDYTRSPDTTGSAAIDPIFAATEIKNEGGQKDFPQYWTSSSHLSTRGSDTGVYFAFGRSLGFMPGRRTGEYRLMDVHGAGSQRSDPKVGDASKFPHGRGPQGDVIRIDNMVRCVRGGTAEPVASGPKVEPQTNQQRRGPPGGGNARSGGGPGQGPSGPDDFLGRFDKNKDGQVTKEEFDGRADRFPILDKDGNGIITKEETPSGPPAGRQGGGGSPGQGSQDGNSGRGAGSAGDILSRFDKNKDGQVTKEEFTGPAERFSTLDKDGNGVVTKEEIPSEPASGRRGGALVPRPFMPPETNRRPTNSSSSAISAKPSFIFILTDDMGWTGLSAAMHGKVRESKSDFYQTPNIEALAKQGMRFSHAYSPGPMCTPSRAGILTGKTPAQLHLTTPGGSRVRANDYQKLIAPQLVPGLPEQEDTVAELLKKEGYATAHFGKWHLGSASPGEHGFDYHDGSTGNDGPGAFKDPNPKDVFGITQRAIDFLSGQVQAKKPFYLQLSHFAVHGPTEALQSSIRKFEKLPPGKRHSTVDYAAMTFDLDTAVGTLLEKIDELGISENTYVVLMSDNGAPGNRNIQSNTPLAAGKGTLYEGGIRVPLMVRGPGIKPNTYCAESVTGCDLLPTFCELAGAKVGQIEGASLLPLLHGRPGKFQRAEESRLFHFPHYGKNPLQKPHSAIILKNYKLLKHYDSDTVELFDLEADIGETDDLSKQMPEKAKEMEKLMNKRLEDVDAQMPTKNPDYDPSAESSTSRRGKRR